MSQIEGTPVDPTTISWVWNIAGGAVQYHVYNGETSLELSNSPVATNAITQSALLGNTSHSIWVTPEFPGPVQGTLLAGPTVFTLATPPVAAAIPITDTSRFGFVGHWNLGAGSNGTDTDYLVRRTRVSDSNDDTGEVTDAFQFDFNDAQPNTEYLMEVAARNGDDVESAFTVLGTTITFAESPTNAAVTSNQPGSLGISWEANGNPNTTHYEVKYSSTGNFTTHSVTFIPFTSNFTGLTTTITGLLTGRTYTIHITPRNTNHFLAAPAQLVATTTNGGGPAGNIQQTIAATAGADLAGTIGADRQFSMRVAPNTFDQAVTLLISTHALIAQCGGLDAALAITAVPALQPRLPVIVSYTVPQGAITSPSRATLVRYDPVSNSCVPLRSSVSSGGGLVTVTALTAHFSLFGIQMITPAGALSTARVFPNPFYVRRQGLLTIDRLMANTRVRIYTLRGEEVFDETASAAGLAVWDGTNKNGHQISSGLYMISLDAGGTRDILKVVVLR